MWQSIGLTLLLLLGHTLIRRLIHKSLLALGQSKQVSENRVLDVAHVFHFLLGCATLLVLAGVWGLDFSRLVVLASSFFAVLGVAMVAQWSILSNITASITIFFAFPYKIGDRIRILDKDDSVTGVITEIGLFYVRVRDDNGDSGHLSGQPDPAKAGQKAGGQGGGTAATGIESNRINKRLPREPFYCAVGGASVRRSGRGAPPEPGSRPPDADVRGPARRCRN